jgi:hypothetical protein
MVVYTARSSHHLREHNTRHGAFGRCDSSLLAKPQPRSHQWYARNVREAACFGCVLFQHSSSGSLNKKNIVLLTNVLEQTACSSIFMIRECLKEIDSPASLEHLVLVSDSGTHFRSKERRQFVLRHHLGNIGSVRLFVYFPCVNSLAYAANLFHSSYIALRYSRFLD